MRNQFSKGFAVAVALVVVVVGLMAAGPVTGEQVLLGLKYISGGVQAQGAKVLQTGEVNTLSAAVASATLAQVVAAPASGSIYLRGVFVEASTGAAGTYTVKSGTGTNCGTGTATIYGPVTNPPVGLNRIEILVAATKALCLQTDASTTSVRALTN